MTEVTSNPVETANNAAATNSSETQPVVQNYTDGYSYEVPRPFLTLQQAASVLGMTLRSIERSVLGKWGNKLPDGWAARKMRTTAGNDWRILPPPGFRVKLNAVPTEFEPDYDGEPSMAEEQPARAMAHDAGMHQMSNASDALNFFGTTGATTNPGNQAKRKQQPWRPERHTLDQPTIVIDRTEEVERLLRELVATKSALAEERRVHLEDLRMITQMRDSMRLLEVNAAEQARAKAELELAKEELSTWKNRYTILINMPWWRRLFRKDV